MSKPDFTTHFVRGIDHFNAREFWDAHEAWEEIWLVAESNVEQFLQGLIQVAAAYHHLKRGTFAGGVRLFDAGLRRLAQFPPRFCGLERESLERSAGEHRLWAAQLLEEGRTHERLADVDYPTINANTSAGSLAPPSERW